MQFRLVPLAKWILSAARLKRTSDPRKEHADLKAQVLHDGFDAEYYISKYPDVTPSGLDPLNHFIQHGRPQNRFASLLVEQAFCAGFDPLFYSAIYPDVAASGFSPVSHYIKHGKQEGRLAKRPNENTTTTLLQLCNPYSDEHYPIISDKDFLVSVLTPVYNTRIEHIQQLYQTLRNQLYGNWEWVVVDDGSTITSVLAELRGYADLDYRVRVFTNEGAKGISSASNIALGAARGNYCALVDHDDLLSRDALIEVYRAWRQSPRVQLFYTDECKVLTDDTLADFWAKPAWSPAYLENTMLVGHLAVYLKDFMSDLGGFRSTYDGTQDFDLALRASRANPQVVHIAVFAYLWRIIPGSTAGLMSDKSYAVDRQADALLDHASKKHALATVEAGFSPGYWRVKYPLPATIPRLSFVIPAGGGRRQSRGKSLNLVVNCVQSFIEKEFYPNMEFLVLCNGSLPSDQEEALSQISSVRLMRYSMPDFSFSAVVNLGVKEATGEFVCLCNDDIEAITQGGGRELVSYLAVNPTIGAISPVCLFENETIQQNGIILIEDGPAHAATGLPRNAMGHAAMLRCRREVMCVGGAIFISRKEVYESLGGFAKDLPMNYNDVDYGLRLKSLGYTSVIDPNVEVFHFESATKSATPVVEQERLFSKHQKISDEYFNKRFDQKDSSFSLDFKSRDGRRPFGSWLDRRLARRCADAQSDNRFKFSVVVILGQQPKGQLVELVQSVRMQTYTNKELIIVYQDLPSDEARVWTGMLARSGEAKIVEAPHYDTSEQLLSRIRSETDGDYLVLIEPDHFLCVDALQQMAHAAEKHSKPAVVYSDHYRADKDSIRCEPVFKPDFDLLLLTNMWYIGSIIAIGRDAFQNVEAIGQTLDFGSLVASLLHNSAISGFGPCHVRETIYAERMTGKDPIGGAQTRRFVERLIGDRGLEGALSLQTSTVAGKKMRKLIASRPVEHLKIVDARELWTGEHEPLASLADDRSLEWVAILLDPTDEETVLRLSAVAWFEPRVNAVSGVFVDPEGLVRASGGVFLPGGRVFDPYLGAPFDGGGYVDMLLAQRCVDIAAPVNVLIRTSALRRVRTSVVEQCANSLMSTLGLAAHESGEFVAVTPNVMAHAPSFVDVTTIDRFGSLLGAPALKDGSRWYNRDLEVEHPFCMPGMTPIWGLRR